MSLVSDLGFEAVDAGPLTVARLLEPLGMLWIELALKRGRGRDFAFAMVRRFKRSEKLRGPAWAR
jgi:predicted dinucleotide-binding enzyme